MRIGLNLLHAVPGIGGSWNYIENLLTALGAFDRRNAYVAYATEYSASLVPDQPNFVRSLVQIDSRRRPRRILFENTILQQMARRDRLDCMHWFANTQAILNAVPGVVTVYDLKPFYTSEPSIKLVYLRVMIWLAARRSRLMLPMSQATAGDLHTILNVKADRTAVIPPVMSDEFAPVGADRAAQLRKAHGLPDQFWLYVAHFYPHKNHVLLLRAYHLLKTQGLAPWPLVLRGDDKGAESQVARTIDELQLHQDVIQLPRLDYGELPALYSAATALVFPSLFEGCGIPVIEAMACGCPVVAADIAPVRESANLAPRYFDPSSIESVAEAMAACQSDDLWRDRSRGLGLQRAELFRGPVIADMLLGAYQKAVARQP